MVRVIDGDTVKVRMRGVRRDVRMLGLDSPEMPNQCGAETATKMLTTKLPAGTRVLLISDVTQPKTDRYSRLLRYVEKGSTDTSLWQIRKGNANVLVVGEKFIRFTEYRSAQRSAKRHDRGIGPAVSQTGVRSRACQMELGRFREAPPHVQNGPPRQLRVLLHDYRIDVIWQAGAGFDRSDFTCPRLRADDPHVVAVAA